MMQGSFPPYHNGIKPYRGSSGNEKARVCGLVVAVCAHTSYCGWVSLAFGLGDEKGYELDHQFHVLLDAINKSHATTR